MDTAGETYTPGVIYLHIFPRWKMKNTINSSPFSIKVETWFRINNIPYQTVETVKYSNKTSQIPYIILDGEEYCDSGAIISLVSQQRNINRNDGLTPEQAGTARSVLHMLDDCFSLTYMMYRYVYHQDQLAAVSRFIKGIFAPEILPSVKEMYVEKGHAMGLGRHGKNYVTDSSMEDIRAMSLLLGDKPYIFGNKPHEVDCCMFSHLSQIIHVDIPFPQKALFQNECKNLLDHYNRMKNQFWPDWDQILQKSEQEYNENPDKILDVRV